MKNVHSSRRKFLADVGRGALVATVGFEAAFDLGLSPALAEGGADRLEFGSLEPLVRLMQETPAERLLPLLAGRLKAGVSLRDLVAAGALANARTFGGEDYIGFHTLMALGPSLHMSREMPEDSRALPIFKVLYRNTRRIQENGGRSREVLHPVTPAGVSQGTDGAALLGEAIHARQPDRAEQILAGLIRQDPNAAFNALLMTVQEQTEVHRVVLPYRAWDLADLIGRERAEVLLRQSVRYCVKAEGYTKGPAHDVPRTVLTKLLDQYQLLSKPSGQRKAEAGWLDKFSETLLRSTPEQAAGAMAAALAEGFDPAHLGEALTLAANQLLLRDMGRSPREESPGKPVGSVHGDSIGVHALDSANAWRNLARVSNARNRQASLILGAYQVALDRVNRGGDFLNWAPLPVAYHLKQVTDTTAGPLLAQAGEAIRGNLQAHAAAIIHRYGELGLPERPVFDLLLKYAVSEDGSLHAEKFYRTVVEEFASTRSAFRWRHLVGLARVTASEYGRPAAGVAEAVELLKRA